MTSLSIKNVPEAVVDRLRHRAQRNHRSLQGELLAILEEAVRPQHVTLLEARQRVKELGLSTGAESQSMVREDRDAR
ncbi:MAG: Arc family DNA-binding protein [Dehalococcoidia bacterium]